MKGRVSLSKESYSLVLDIYLGGVSGAIVKNGAIEHVSHNKALITSENEPQKLLAQTEMLLFKALDDLASKKKIAQTYIFIDAPLSYSESHEVLFQNTDTTFFEQSIKEIEGTLDLPIVYTELLGLHASDGVILEHPPQNHTLNGYPTSNLALPGERKADVVQQYIQRNVYTALQKAKQTYSLGKQIFLPNLTASRTSIDVLMLGEIVSVYYHGNKNTVLNIGTGVVISKCAQEHNQSSLQVESTLKSIERTHGTKNVLYKDVVKDFTKAFAIGFKKDTPSDNIPHPTVYVGDSFMFPVVEDALTQEKNMDFVEIYKGVDARLAYIVKSKVQ
jgi:hypothetical protein